jgi:membrane protein
MPDQDPPDPDQRRFALDDPTIAGRIARWLERGRVLRTRVEAARSRSAAVDVGFIVVERDSSIGGGLLAGALAYRLFILLLPTALLFVSGLGLYASSVDEKPGKVARDAGLHGLIASQVASSASSGARWIVFVVMVPAVLYALVKLYRAIAVVYAIVWYGSGRGVRITSKGVALMGLVFLLNVVAAAAVGWIRRHEQFGALSALIIYLALGGGSWLAVSLHLPHRNARWSALIPGALVVGAGLLLVNVFNVYVTTRLVEDRANTYGALGIATALLLSLVLVGRLIIVAAELNASLAERRQLRNPGAH